MKRGWIYTALTLLIVIGFGQSANAQEKKEVNRIKIVTVDENGEKVIIDTIVTDLDDIKELKTIDGKSIGLFISDDNDIDLLEKSNKQISWTISTTDGDSKVEKHGVKIFKCDTLHWFLSEGDKDINMFSVTKMKKDGGKMIIITDNDDENEFTMQMVHEKLMGDEKEIIVRSADGEDIFRIKGNAVITIKDGKVSVNSGDKNPENKVVKESKEKIVKKKKN